MSSASRSRAMPLTRGRHREADGLVVGLVPPGAETDVEPAVRDEVERRERLREHRGGTQRLAQHERAEPRARDGAGERGQRRQRLERAVAGRRAAVLREVEEEVVRQPQRVEARAPRPAARSARSVSYCSGDSPGDRVVVLRKREAETHGAEPTVATERRLACAGVRAERVGGADAEVLATLAAACGASLLDVHPDADHHRSVFTLAGPGPRDGDRRGAGTGPRRRPSTVDLRAHDGVHPRLGALDVVPFVALDDEPGEWRWRWTPRATSPTGSASELGRAGVPLRRGRPRGAGACPTPRRDAFVRRAPDHGPAVTRPAARRGRRRRPAPARRGELLARHDDVAVARGIADGGARAGRRAAGRAGPGLRARRASARPQVSMNLVDLDATGLETACTEVRRARRSRRRPGHPGRAGRAGARGRARTLRSGVPRLGRPRPRRHDRGPPRALNARFASKPAVMPGFADAKTAWVRRWWRCRGVRARAGVGPGAAPARTGRPRSRTSRRAGARTRGTRPAPHSPGTPPWPPGSTHPAPGRTGRDRPRGSSPAPASRAPPRVASGLQKSHDLLNLHRHPPRCHDAARPNSDGITP